MNTAEINALSHIIVGAAIEVHRILGPGVLEHAYQVALAQELTLRGVKVSCEVEIPFVYKGVELGTAYRADMLVNDEIIVELKATEKDSPVYYKQLLTYLKLSNRKLGLLINFNHEKLSDGLKRVVNRL